MSRVERVKYVVLALFVAGVIAFLLAGRVGERSAHAFSSGPPAGYTRAPGEEPEACAECHVTDSAGTGQISINAPQSYVPGQSYLVTVTHTNPDPTRRRWGFQLTALDDSDQKAGTLESTDNLTRVLNNEGPFPNRQYIEQTTLGGADGTFDGQQNGASWTFRWTAPATDIGPIVFYAAGNHANGDFNTSGDNIYFTFVTSVPTTSAPDSFEFTASSYTVAENNSSATITVKRNGAASAPATVDFTTVNGQATDRADFNLALGTLQFASGEREKTFGVFITDDAFVEGNESLSLALSNPTGGAILGSFATASLTITDNDTQPPAANPIDDPRFFVRQHYVDFLNREPDTPGLNFWVNQIEECGANAGCREVRRNNVSAAFFLSGEFQETGYLVYRFHQSAFNTAERLKLTAFLPDTQKVGRGVIVGAPGWEQLLEQNTQAFANEFVARPQFVALYPATMTAAQFVDALNANTGGALTQGERDALVNALNGATLTRAQVLRAVAENAEFDRRQKNRAFVLMQYFGYLRRNPNDQTPADFSGYNFWLNKLNQFNGNYIAAEMVKAFITSSEYRQRFGL